jgi:phage terminase large subunit-like protein
LFCRQSKGRWANQPLALLDWQRDFLMRLFGWRSPGGKRRFRTAYLEVAKKNGKSTLISAIVLFLLLADGESAPEVYLNAVDREQASIVFDEAARMVKASPELAARLEVIPSKGRILDALNNGKIQKNSADAPSKDGVNASGIVFDEIHRFKSRELWDVFKYAGTSREQPLRVGITTAGEEEEGVWFEQRSFSEGINDGAIQDTSHLGVIHRAIVTDDLESPDTWRKANPSLGITIVEADFRREFNEAKLSPAEWGNFLRLRLNIVIRGETKFLAMSAWNACAAAPTLAADEPAYLGLDLSETQDLSALVLVRGNQADGIDVHARFWLPEDNIVELERKHQQPYRTWAEEGLIELTPGTVIDYAFIRAEVVLLASQADIRKICADPYNATKLGIELKEQDGLPIEFLRQGYLSLSAPTKELLRLVLGGKLRHGGNPILRWHANNAVSSRDPAGNVKLNKEKSKKKIDGLSALVNAIAAMSGESDGERSVYEDRGLIFI